MIRALVAFSIVIVFYACSTRKDGKATSLKTGIWRAVLSIQGQQLPFNFELVKDDSGSYNIYIINAEERLLLDEVAVNDDSINISLHVFDANIKAVIQDDTLRGEFIKNYEEDYRIPFTAVYGNNFRFAKPDQTQTATYSGKYDVTFTSATDTVKAVGIFNQEGNRVTGTFLLHTGDYRYLEGNIVNGKMHLSTFDGNHTYLFIASKQENEKLTGMFYSGKNGKSLWEATKNEKASLPDATSLTYLKSGFEKIDFTFPDVHGKLISLQDEKYKNKVVVLQLFGTWCPNCLDETKFLTSWYDQNKDRGVEIIGLAYERKDDFSYASTRIKKLINKHNIKYDCVIAGTNDKEKASATLPMLNKIIAFPTTIFLDKEGKVRKIHTGFSGPGTGIYYKQFTEEFNETINELLKDN